MQSEHAGRGAVRSGNGSRFRRCGAVLVHVQCCALHCCGIKSCKWAVV